ncbi:maltase A1-like [Battus philenor]|uniref:maltase A1-like n=1 Tax=Battus philenor TaxID=42288 RepID=UPI0035D0F6B3
MNFARNVITPIEERELEWWETTIFYQIYTRSFADSDGDGIGDLNGITSKLDHVKEIGAGAICLSPIFQSPMYDFGYDISDFYAIHDEYGTMDDFYSLLAKATELDIKIILSLVPNHISNESMWFQEALNGSEKYYDYFIWETGVIDSDGKMHPPNNWRSHFRGSAWEYKEEIGKYYLHQFFVAQPDLNYYNIEVIEEMKNIIKFWLDKGVAGFKINAANCLFEVNKELYDGKFPDEPLSGNRDPDSYDYLEHVFTKDQNETYYVIYEWRELFDEFSAEDGLKRIMMTEANAAIQDVAKYFGENERDGAQIPLNFDLISDVDASSSAGDMKRAIDKFLTYKPVNKAANWVVGNHDNSRMATRYGSSLVDGINMIVLLLPGVAVTYMGEEIGMLDGYISWKDTVDSFGCNTNDPINYIKNSRDPERTPFHWNAKRNAGFSTADKTWVPVAQGYETLNVQVQNASERSHLKVYQDLADLRQNNIFRYGRYDSVAMNKDVFVFRRWHQGQIYLVLVNMGKNEHLIDLRYFENVYADVSIVIRSVNSPKYIGDTFVASALPVVGFESLVLKHVK